MARELLGTSYAFERVERMASFDMYRFLPPFRVDSGGQHIGELITDHKGRTADRLGTAPEEIVRRVRAAGFGSLLR